MHEGPTVLLGSTFIYHAGASCSLSLCTDLHPALDALQHHTLRCAVPQQRSLKAHQAGSSGQLPADLVRV